MNCPGPDEITREIHAEAVRKTTDVPDTRLVCLLEDLGPVSLDPVGGADDRRLWEAMMATHHPLGWARPPGGQMRYWIRAERHGTLSGIGFGSATWQLRARDEWIGWSADARATNIERVICNHRFPLMPGVRVHGQDEEHGGGPAGHLSGEGGTEGRLPAAVEPEDIHGARSGTEFRGDRRPLPGGAGRPCLQDTTALNRSGLEATEGRPLGLFAMARHSGRIRRRTAGAGSPGSIGRGSSRRPCPGTRVVSVCDREGDFWDLLAHAVDDGDAPRTKNIWNEMRGA